MDIISWFKKIFTKPQNENKKHSSQYNGCHDFISQCHTLDIKRQKILIEKKQIKSTSTDWFNINISQPEKRSSINTYEKYEFAKVLTLKELKEQRLHQELIKLKETEKKAKLILDNTAQAIKQRDVLVVQRNVSELHKIIAKVKDDSLKKRFKELLQDFNLLKDDLHREELRRQEEERRRREEQERTMTSSSRCWRRFSDSCSSCLGGINAISYT